jgi:hypothetical protein
VVERNGLCPSRYASIRTRRELTHTLFGGSVHRMRSVFIRATKKALQSSERSLCSLRIDQVRNLRTRLMRSEAVGHEAAAYPPRRIRRFTIDAVAGYLLSFFSFTHTSLFFY